MTTFFRNARVYKLTAAADWFQHLNADLDPWRFKEAGATDMQSVGWVPPCDHADGLAHHVGGQILLRLCVQKKLLPASVVNQEASRRAALIAEQQGYRPGRKQMKEIKEQVTDDLLPKAFSKLSFTHVWLDPVNRFLVIDSATAARSDEVMGMLAKAFDPFPVAPLYTEISSARVMTGWLAADEAPENFTIDQDTELQSSNESRAKVRYMRQSIDPEDARKHIEAGKQCARLAMTWADRVSFVLDDDFTLRRITPLDVIRDQPSTAQDQAEQFDSDFALMAGELGKLLRDLIAAHGGEKAHF